MHLGQGIDQTESVRTKRPDPVCPRQIDDLEVVAGDVVGSGQTTMPWPPLCAASITTPPSWLIGTETIARSIRPESSAIDQRSESRNWRTIGGDRGYVAMKATAQHRIDQALDSITLPVHNDPLSAFSSRRTEALSARCSRRSITPTEVSVGKIGNSTASTPSSMPFDTR